MPIANNPKEHKITEQSIKDNELLYKELFNSAREPILITKLDGKIISANMASASALGYESVKDLMSHNVSDFYLHHEQRKIALDELIKKGYIEDYELDFVKKDGARINVLVSSIIRKDEYGSIRQIEGFFKDVTKLKQAEEVFKQRNDMLAAMNKLAIELASLPSNINLQEFIAKRLKDITGAVVVGLSDYDPDNRVLVVNHMEINQGLLDKVARLLGKRVKEVRSPVSEEMYHEIVSEIVGKRETLTEVTFGAIPSLVSAAIQKLIDVNCFIGMAYVVEGELYGTSMLAIKTGAPEPSFDLLESFANMAAVSLRQRRAEEALKRQLEVGKRITKELEEKTRELSRSNTELNSFVYTASHDLKTPLVSLQGFSTLLMNTYSDKVDETGKLYIDRIQKNTERMGILINDLLELSRIGRIKSNEQTVNIMDIISDVTNDLGLLLESRGTKLIVKGKMPIVYCDRTRITQVFSNLISNANKFIGDDNNNPTIEIGCDSQDRYYRFYVKDNGIGIDKNYHEKIFQIFERLNDVKADGTGIGLAIVKKLVENFNGNIWVDSEKGKGTTVYFTMPKKN